MSQSGVLERGSIMQSAGSAAMASITAPPSVASNLQSRFEHAGISISNGSGEAEDALGEAHKAGVEAISAPENASSATVSNEADATAPESPGMTSGLESLEKSSTWQRDDDSTCCDCLEAVLNALFDIFD